MFRLKKCKSIYRNMTFCGIHKDPKACAANSVPAPIGGNAQKNLVNELIHSRPQARTLAGNG
jgi:hypothetical protein